MNKKSYIYDIDWILVLLYLLMVLFGWMNIYAAAFNESMKGVFDLDTTYGNQFFWIMVSFLFILILIILDYKLYHFFAYFIYGGSILLLLIVLIFGIEVHGAKSWIKIAGLSLQPSEFAKTGVAIALARYLSGYQITKLTVKTFFICIGFIAVPFLLILAQPDPGTAIVFSIFILVLYREGLPGWILLLLGFLAALFLFSLVFNIIYILIGLYVLSLAAHFFIHRKQSVFIYSLVFFTIIFFAFILINRKFDLGFEFTVLAISSILISGLIYLFVALRSKLPQTILVIAFFIGSSIIPYTIDFAFDHLLKPHQQKRVNIMIGKEVDPKGYGYNVNQSKIAIGSGGFSGKGYLNGTQTKLEFVPEQATDFIFCTVGEEWGFMGTAFVVLLFAGLLIRIVFVAERQRFKFNRIYAYGVASILLFHFVVNISMTIGLFPVIGIPLPFFSKGGSSLLGFTILLFILIRLDASRKSYLK